MTYRVYMINPERDRNSALFKGTRYLNKFALDIDAESYDKFGPYEKSFKDGFTDEDICELIFIDHQNLGEGYKMRSMSVSDIIELDPDTNPRFYMCDSRGWARLYQFVPAGAGKEERND